MSLSSLGFGYNPFGDHQFGSGDWAEEILWKNMPAFYRECDESGPVTSLVDHPLRGFIDAIKPSLQALRLRWEDFPELWDANTVPLAQLPQLAYNVGISVDPTKSEGLQRSSVLNAAQLWLNKGTDRGYQITAAFEGLLVAITPLWAESCAPSIQQLGQIGGVIAIFDLSTSSAIFHPVGPGTVVINVTTEHGIAETIEDDETGGLFGRGNQQNGPLTRLNISPSISLTLASITGVFSVGDTVTQGPNTGTVVSSVGAIVRLNVTFGSFATGAVLDTTSAATATVTATSNDVLEIGETIDGLSSGTTAVVRDNEVTYLLVDKITTLAGFSVGERIRGRTSGDFAITGAQTELVQGPIRFKLTLTGLVGAFVIGEQATGGTSGSIGIVREIAAGFIYVDTITLPGYVVGEVITGGAATATISGITQGTINYLTGAMTGHTVKLAASSTIDMVVRLITTPPTQFLPTYDAVPGDVIPLDDAQTDKYAKWPKRYVPVRIRNGILTLGECRTYSLRLFFYTPNDTEIENFLDVAARIQTSLERFRPIHVRFDKIAFDGARASSQVWYSGTIVAESSAAAVWTADVVANQQASSQVWTQPTINATVAS